MYHFAISIVSDLEADGAAAVTRSSDGHRRKEAEAGRSWRLLEAHDGTITSPSTVLRVDESHEPQDSAADALDLPDGAVAVLHAPGGGDTIWVRREPARWMDTSVPATARPSSVPCMNPPSSSTKPADRRPYAAPTTVPAVPKAPATRVMAVLASLAHRWQPLTEDPGLFRSEFQQWWLAAVKMRLPVGVRAGIISSPPRAPLHAANAFC
ncbi:hypothetical protein ZWY2020_058007 [Hordeum vulgare]|nr:hypothetical protein ZWY2020_058007 [Hordeum vulgare]